MAKHCEYVQQLEHLKIPFESFSDVFSRYKTIKEYAYIIHDKDTYTDKDERADLLLPEDKRKGIKAGELKPPHVHVYLNFGQSAASFDTVASWFGDESQYVSKVLGRKGDILKYLTHANSPEKYQYAENEVITNINLVEEIAKSDAEKDKISALEKILDDYSKDIITYAEAQQLLNENMIADKIWDSIARKIDTRYKVKSKIAAKESRDMEIFMIYGKSGKGKSVYAEMIAETLSKTGRYKGYARSSSANDPLQDYMGEDIFILDDFRDDEGECTPSDLLKLFDNHFNSSFRSRYVNKVFTGKLMIITTSKDPLTWFKGTGEQRWQLFRRISQLMIVEEDKVSYYYDVDLEKDTTCGFVEGTTTDAIHYAKLQKTEPNMYKNYVALKPKEKKLTRDVSALFAEYLFSELETRKASEKASDESTSDEIKIGDLEIVQLRMKDI